MNEFLDRAGRIADDVLFPAALDVDATGAVPETHFALLAEEGCYGAVAPAEIGGAGLDLAELLSAVEIFAGACLSTAYVWLQHHGVLLALADTDNIGLWAEYLGSMMTGRLRGGTAVTGAVGQSPTLVATRCDNGFLLNGVVPFVSGWDHVDVVLLSASDPDSGLIVTGLVDRSALHGADVLVDRLPLAVGAATSTVQLSFADHCLPDDRITRRVRRGEFAGGHWFVSRIHGSLALGIGQRCVRLLIENGRRDLGEIFQFQLTRARGRLDAALELPTTMPTARAEAAELAYRIAGATVAGLGPAAIEAAHHAQRLVRDALFVLVAGSRTDVTTETLRLFGRSPVTSGAVFPPPSI